MLNPSRFEQLMTRVWELLTDLNEFEREYNALGGAVALTDEQFTGKPYTKEEFAAACELAAGCTALVVVKPGMTADEEAAAAQRATFMCKVKQ